MFRSFICGALLCASMAAGAATAQPDPSDAVRIKVTAADLNTPDGVKRLALRLRVAAYEVCGGNTPHGREATDFDACRQSAIEHAVAGIDAPVLARALGLGGETLAQSRR
jgi:UrcA family protein